MAAMTLVEYAKRNQGNDVQQAIVEMYAGSSEALNLLKFTEIGGNAYSYDTRTVRPGVAFRAINGTYTAGAGIINRMTENLVIAGGEIKVDQFLVKTEGMTRLESEIAAQTESLGLSITQKLIKGDVSSSNLEFDGLQARVAGAQKIQSGTTANGTALSLTVLDNAISQTYKPTHIWMSRKMKVRFMAAMRTTTIGGYIQQTRDGIGGEVMSYGGLPIVTFDLDHLGNEILPFDEACTSGTATGTSIYIVRNDEGGVHGIMNGVIDVQNFGKIQAEPVYLTRLEWYMGLVVQHGRAATRIWSIADAAITA